METKTQKMLPKTADQITNGGIYSQRVRCSKSNCKCSRGSFHTAFYFFTRWQGKLLKFYVRKGDLKNFSSIVASATSARKERRRVLNENLTMLASFRRPLRDESKQTLK